ncbi:hypothetical protein RJ639_017850 [Escallonia herrerae]|uniref:Uncharacterized protein n=1 Tax=Escallonia herrerae TaxID=1293975 RepID=A0AA88VAJ5_9ASTE|nr:hypothetical protein RJ639_017850 [Escallonia herrerae]
MSQVPFKACVDKNSNAAISTSLRAAVLIFLVATVSLALYSAAAGRQARWWFRCPGTTARKVAQICHTPAFPEDSATSSPPPTNISHIAFGIAGSSATWGHRRRYSELWWQPNTTRGYVWMDEKPHPNSTRSGNCSSSSPPYRVSDDWTRFKYSGSASAVRIARIVLELFRVGLPDVRWFVMGDDDTVFFVDNLVTVLSRYDHRSMYYIGGNSESVEQDEMHSYEMAFGGGGFAVSYPLAAELAKVLDGCLDRYHYFYGSDQRVWACMNELGVPLTTERGFHQATMPDDNTMPWQPGDLNRRTLRTRIDIRGDPYGLLAAHPVAPLISLHHLDYVKPLFPNQTQFESLNTLIQAYRVDSARTLQQCFCHYRGRRRKWSISISWGYTVQIYPILLTANNLERPLQTFHTWRSWSKGPFTFNTRPPSPDPCEQPIIYYLDWVQEVDNNETLTSYKRYVVESEKKCNKPDYRLAVERVVVSALKMDPDEWKKVCNKPDSLSLSLPPSLSLSLFIVNRVDIVVRLPA